MTIRDRRAAEPTPEPRRPPDAAKGLRAPPAPPPRSHRPPHSSFEQRARSADAPSLTVPPRPRAEPARRPVTFLYDAGPHTQLTDLRLKGGWDANGEPSAQWTEGIPMRPLGDGRWAATVELLDDGTGQTLEWGVTADAPTGDDQWAVFGEGNLKVTLGPQTREVTYAPTTYHRMGAQRVGEDGISFRFWAPNAREVRVQLADDSGRIQRLPLERGADGTWSVERTGAWHGLEGKAYVYEVVDSQGVTQERTDPYARVLQGEQRGVGRFYVDAEGREANAFTPGRTELMRFEIDDEPRATEAYLVFKDARGRVLDRAALLERLGTIDASLISRARDGRFNDLWSENVLADGRIRLTAVDGAFSTLVNAPGKLAGLRYELRAYERTSGGKLRLIDDANGNGRLSAAERKASGYNDRWSDVLTPLSGVSFRGGVIADTSYAFRHDDVPRERDRDRWVIYQAHLGSFLGAGRNTNRSTLEDVTARLDYLQELGINTLELLPTGEVEGNRDWGYMGANTLAVESAYGFEDERGNWVHGDAALKRFIDEAHRRGLNVINDVVYNHVGGVDNDLWNLDGPENPYFNWSTTPGAFEQRDTPWGAVPAYHADKVRQFFVDHAVAQIADHHFDGLRFDFTEPIKGTGGKAGWDLLREINRQVHFVNPAAFTLAEQFDYDPSITEPARPDGTGGGFDAQWYTEFQHRLVRDDSRPGLLQAAAEGRWTDVDAFMSMLTSPRGLGGWSKGVAMISNHDEVGNAQRTIDVADGPGAPPLPDDWARGAARFAAGIGFASPGMPMFFQGDESLARNAFKWGVPGTWDLGWDWRHTGRDWDWPNVTFDDAQRNTYERLIALPLPQRIDDPAYRALSAADRTVFEHLASLPADERQHVASDLQRRQTFEFYKAAIALRGSSPAFGASAEVRRVYTHNDDSVLAFSRKAGGDEFVIVGSLNRGALNGYRLTLPPGQWQEVFTSDARPFGGAGVSNQGTTISGGSTTLDLPAAGYVILRRV